MPRYPMPPHDHPPYDNHCPHHHHHDHCVPDCDDQLPIISRVGRGLKGDDVTAQLVTDEDGHIHLEIYQTDNASGETTKIYDAIVDGGKLRYYYNLEPFNDPATFTITWVYDNADPEKSWSWTTPAIPYIWTADQAGGLQPDDVVGSGVGSIFIRKTSESWELPPATPHSEAEANDLQEKLIYPTGWDRDEFNAPNPTDPWSVNLSYGVGGDIDAPNIDDISKIIGVSPDYIRDIVDQKDIPQTGTDFGTDPSGDPYNVKEYIDLLDEHIHEDMGFGDILINDGDNDTQTPKRNTIKKWFDWLLGKLGFGDTFNTCVDGQGNPITVKQYIDAGDDDLKDYIDNAIGDILDKIVHGNTPHTMAADGHINWAAPVNDATANPMIPAGNLNLYGADDRSKWIKTHNEQANDDVWAR